MSHKEELLRLFKDAEEKVRELMVQYPGDPSFTSIYDQIIYLEQFIAGEMTDVSQLYKINLGVLTVRREDVIPASSVDLFHRVSGEVKRMREDPSSIWKFMNTYEGFQPQALGDFALDSKKSLIQESARGELQRNEKEDKEF